MKLIMNELGKLLRELRGERSLREMSKLTNLSHTYISDLEKGYNHNTKAPINPSAETLKQLSKAYNYPLNELFEKAGYLTYVNIKEYMSSFIKETAGSDEYDMVSLPILGTIRAGEPIDRYESYEGTYPAFKRNVDGYDAFWLKVQGESMSGDEIHDGDMVCVIMTTKVNPSDISVVAVNGNEATLKRVKFLDGKCILTPSNREMEPMIYPANKIYVIGKVVGFQRSFK